MAARRGIALLVLATCAVLPAGAAGVRGSALRSASAVASRFGLANRCLAMVSRLGGHPVTIDGDGYSTSGGATADLFAKPTRLGAYMLYDQGARLLAADGTAVTRSAAPSPAAEWEPARASRRWFTVRSTQGGVLAATASGGLRHRTAGGGRATEFEFVAAQGCRRFPEARVDARGPGLREPRPNGKVIGFADYHLHITADMRAGGQTIYGRNFSRFGIADALGHDADVHGPDGSLDVTGNLLRTGSPVGTHDTHGWPTFAGWPTYDTYTHQQTYYVWLERAWRAGERLVVAQMVEDQPLCEIEPRRSHSCDETQTVELEIRRLRALEHYVDAQSGGPGRGWLRIVTSPAQARRAIDEGKLAVVIGMEASDPFGCSERLGQPQCTRADVDAGLRELRALGLRGMFIAHWIDNAFAGAALEPGAKGTFIRGMQVEQTGQPFRTEPCAIADEADGECNAKGLTPLGRYLVQRLMADHMIIEVDHLSQKARSSVMKLAARRHYPLVSSHTGTGGAWTPDQLRRLYRLGGLASATLDPAPELARKLDVLRRFRSSRYYFGAGLGTDTGGFNALPGPRADATTNPLRYPFHAALCHLTLGRERTGTRRFDLNRDGVAHYGLIPDLLADTRHQPGGRQAIHTLFRSAEAYLEMWQRAHTR